MAPSVPTKIGKYDVVDVIGRGGMGIVYKATDPHLDRLVAIKMMTGGFVDNPDLLKRFFREAQSLGSLQHPNIVTVYDLGDYGGNPYLVMQYLEGDGLDSVLINRRQLSLLDKITLIIQVCHGLSYAHRRGVVHRDIKPANIMLAKDGSVKIFDFGIAHVGHQSVTRTGQIVGTLSYMAPEQVNAQPVDARTDLFSTGVVLYQLFTNHLPFEGENTATTLLKIVHEPPPPLRNFLPTYPPEMENILLRALAKNPDDRYSSADEFALDLTQLQGQLKQELIEQEMQEVALFLDRGEIYKAQDSLVRVLKIDQHQTSATRLLREVQQRIQKEEIGKQVRGLREQAEEALSNERFDTAQEYVDRALGLDRNNPDLQELRESVRNAALRAEKLHNALKTAESAHLEGKLEAAKQAAEEALEVAPDDAQAKALYRVISRDLTERSRQRQMEGYLFEARQEISSRKFTAALEILKHAEALDPVAPQVHALIESAVAGREQERRRRELEAITHEVEDALNRDDYRAACLKADDGLERFPDERTLLKLKALADRQRQIEERKQLIDEQLAVARRLLQEGRNEELQETLEAAIAKIGAEPRLQSLLAVVRENVQRERLERRKAECLQKAKESLRNQAYDEAIHTLETIAKEITDDAEIQNLLARARTEKGSAVQTALWRAQQESVLDLRVTILEEALRKAPQEGELQEQLHNVRDLGKLISTTADDAAKLEQAHQYDQALKKWEAVRSAYRHYPDLENIIKRVKGLRDKAHTDARANWIARIKGTLDASDFAQAANLVEQAIQEFPWDSDLMELKESAEVGARLRAKAQKILSEARKSFASQQWEQGAEAMVRAFQVATQDPLIREETTSELLQASRTAMEKNWRAAEVILRRLSEIQPTGAVPAEMQAKIQERKREELIGGALDGAKRLQSAGDLQGALRELAQALVSYPDERRLRESQDNLRERIKQVEDTARVEKERKEKEAFVLDAMTRAKQALVLDARVQILEEALRKEPREVRLLQQVTNARELRNKVSSLVSEARSLEQARDYDQALAKWEALSATYREFPDLDHIIEQARKRQQDARNEARANWVKTIQGALADADFKLAEDLVGQANRQFPRDRELADIESKVRKGIASRVQAEKILADAAKATGKAKWKKAWESFQLASETASADPIIRDQVLRGLLQAADAALSSDAPSAEMFLAQAVQIQPGSPLLAPVKSRIETRKRDQVTQECLNAASRCEVAADFPGALRALERGLSTYPMEQRLFHRREEIEGQIRKRDEAQKRELEREQQRKEDDRKAREQQRQVKPEVKPEVDRVVRTPAMPIAAQPRGEMNPLPLPPSMMQGSAMQGPALQGSATRVFVPGAPVLPDTAPPVAMTVDQPPIAPNIEAATENPPAAPISSLHTLPTHLSLVVPVPVGPAKNEVLGEPPRSERADAWVPSAHSELTDVDPALGTMLQADTLRLVERQLASFIGPLAKVLVKRAACNTSNIEELYTILSMNLEREADRKAFLARRSELTRVARPAPPQQSQPTPPPAAAASSSLELTHAAIDQAARKLAAHLGPIAAVLARKAAKQTDNLRTFYRLLAEHVESETERARFLKDAGFQEPAPSATLTQKHAEHPAPAPPAEQAGKTEQPAHPEPKRKVS